MKKLTGIVAISFMAGMIGGGIGERIADEVWAPKAAHAASGKFSARNCRQIRDAYTTNMRYWNIIVEEHC